VYWWFRRFVRRLLFNMIRDIALMVDRERAGREASPSAAEIDSQSVKAPATKERGFDAAKKIVGRKRHIAVDTDVNLTTAAISDSAGGRVILDAIRKPWPWVKHLFADGAYDRATLMDKAAFLDFVIEVVRSLNLSPKGLVDRVCDWRGTRYGSGWTTTTRPTPRFRPAPMQSLSMYAICPASG
jgi:hypothetical protein